MSPTDCEQRIGKRQGTVSHILISARWLATEIWYLKYHPMPCLLCILQPSLNLFRVIQ